MTSGSSFIISARSARVSAGGVSDPQRHVTLGRVADAKALAEAAGWRQRGFLYSHPTRGNYRVSDMDGWIDLCDNEGIIWEDSGSPTKAAVMTPDLEHLLDDLLQTLQHARGFLVSREQMHREDLKRFDAVTERLKLALTEGTKP